MSTSGLPGQGPLEITLLAGTRELLRAHARELPQRDDLCGAFCGALALRAAGLVEHAGAPLDQDEVALAADTVIAHPRELGTLPHGELGRRDYRVELPLIDDPELSGTNTAGLLEALATLSGGALSAIPYAGPWSERTLAGLFDTAAALEHPVSLLANLATGHLWGARPSVTQLLAYLYGEADEGPPSDWDVGHFVCVVGRVHGPARELYCLADTYPALGDRGVHLQPRERLAAALARPEKPAGGIIVVVSAEDAPTVRAGAAELGLSEHAWDNGSVTRETLR